MNTIRCTGACGGSRCSDAGNLATWIVPRREIEQAIAAALPVAERIRRLAPDAIRIGVAPRQRRK